METIQKVKFTGIFHKNGILGKLYWQVNKSFCPAVESGSSNFKMLSYVEFRRR